MEQEQIVLEGRQRRA